MSDSKYIKVTKNGPYMVYGVSKIVEQVIVPGDDGAPEKYVDGKDFSVNKSPVALCRCGNSKNPPFCDGSHAKFAWDGEETAGFEPIMDEAEEIRGPNLTLFDNEKYCAFARFCDAKGRIWNLVAEGSSEADAQAIKEAHLCPAGRLMMYDNKTDKPIEAELEASIGVLEDPSADVSGPLWVKGGIQLVSADNKNYEPRKSQCLCRCGQSSNKPFCDGSHAGVGFNDGIEIPRRDSK